MLVSNEYASPVTQRLTSIAPQPGDVRGQVVFCSRSACLVSNHGHVGTVAVSA